MTINEIYEVISNSLNLKVENLGEIIKVSVPNDSKYAEVKINKAGEIEVSGCGYNSTYRNINDAILEILEILVSRELFSEGFSINEIKYVISKLLK